MGNRYKKIDTKPLPEIKNDLARIIRQTTEKGSRPFTGRGRKIEEKTVTRFWEIVPINEDLRFALNLEHPIYLKLLESGGDKELLISYLKGVQSLSAFRGDSVKSAA